LTVCKNIYIFVIQIRF